jgi:hypothetical protein
MAGATTKTNNKTKDKKKMNTETLKQLETLRQEYHDGDHTAKYKILEIVTAAASQVSPAVTSTNALSAFFKHTNAD